MLGNMMESSTASIDRNYYGDIHNMGHIFMAFAHDPEHRHLESFGVLGNLNGTLTPSRNFNFNFDLFIFKVNRQLRFVIRLSIAGTHSSTKCSKVTKRNFSHTTKKRLDMKISLFRRSNLKRTAMRSQTFSGHSGNSQTLTCRED